MHTLKTIRRVTVYAAQGHEKSLIEHFLGFGAKGYTITETRGLGEHAALDDPLARSTHVRIELLDQLDAAEKIMTYLAGLSARHLPIQACVDSVDVFGAEHF